MDVADLDVRLGNGRGHLCNALPTFPAVLNPKSKPMTLAHYHTAIPPRCASSPFSTGGGEELRGTAPMGKHLRWPVMLRQGQSRGRHYKNACDRRADTVPWGTLDSVR